MPLPKFNDFGEPLEQFLSYWRIKRDGHRRGIVETRS